jgi:hypothetical protein
MARSYCFRHSIAPKSTETAWNKTYPTFNSTKSWRYSIVNVLLAIDTEDWLIAIAHVFISKGENQHGKVDPHDQWT